MIGDQRHGHEVRSSSTRDPKATCAQIVHDATQRLIGSFKAVKRALEPSTYTDFGSIESQRRPSRSATANLAFLASLAAPVADKVLMQSLSIIVDDGAEVAARWYTR